MRSLKVLGPGCPRCEQLASRTKMAADQLGLEVEIEKVTDIARFAEFGLMLTPGLVVDGELKVHGKLPTLEELKDILQAGGGS